MNPLGDNVTYRAKHPSRLRCRNARLGYGWNGDPATKNKSPGREWKTELGSDDSKGGSPLQSTARMISSRSRLSSPIKADIARDRKKEMKTRLSCLSVCLAVSVCAVSAGFSVSTYVPHYILIDPDASHHFGKPKHQLGGERTRTFERKKQVTYVGGTFQVLAKPYGFSTTLAGNADQGCSANSTPIKPMLRAMPRAPCRTVLLEGRGDGTLSGWWTGRNLSWSYGRAAERLSFATLLTTYATLIGDLACVRDTHSNAPQI
ncbi:uncharacterized protein BO88DRAFT_429372 [Aspergillus vadensis CBS 113365]|uniref:Uncharacterized protein n=1 Tax=Aspergillus vadensis (strain CBS 113365 / IMI 142717 / IBT 24658) TaxID=1448311 RepID=A0A319AW69_ASPVC|nr:hypothetical protein BO88DRAFT_429372 [Aspergillus vadensis CBS 113365]PYH64607.1 hypothetical protein BO88DRAFT_429372 [Aspergillus vadensis CBS 113365]